MIQYPSLADYEAAFLAPDRLLLDPKLKGGEALRLRDGRLRLYSGQFAGVFVVEAAAATYGVKCWLGDIGDAGERYKIVSRFIERHSRPHFVSATFVERGVIARGQSWPILRMDWLEACSLKEFVKKNLHCPARLLELAGAFRAIVREMHALRVSHGDLQADNIVVEEHSGQFQLKLIDYDTMWAAEMGKAPRNNTGIPGFQHPLVTRGDPDWMWSDERADYFSEMVVFLSLTALESEPTLWEELDLDGNDQELLFGRDDLAAPDDSRVFSRLRGLGGPVRELALVLEGFCRCSKPEELVPLEKALSGCSVPAPSGAGVPNLSSDGSYARPVSPRASGGSARPAYEIFTRIV